MSAKKYPVHYGNYGRFTLFQMETLHGKWYVQGDFDTGVVKDGKNSWIFREDYQDVAMHMQELECGMADADDALRNQSYNYPELNFYLGRNVAGALNAAGCYDIKQKDRVNIRFLHSTVHEYCHYLLLQEGVFLENGIFQEAYNTQLHLLPYYYGMFTESGYSYFQERYEVMGERLGWKAEWESFSQKLQEKLGGEILIHDRESMEELMHFFAALSKAEIKLSEVVLTKGNHYQEEYMAVLGSFSIYLADTYGEDILYLISTGNDEVEELTGHTYEEFVREWEGYLQESYGV